MLKNESLSGSLLVLALAAIVIAGAIVGAVVSDEHVGAIIGLAVGATVAMAIIIGMIIHGRLALNRVKEMRGEISSRQACRTVARVLTVVVGVLLTIVVSGGVSIFSPMAAGIFAVAIPAAYFPIALGAVEKVFGGPCPQPLARDKK